MCVLVRARAHAHALARARARRRWREAFESQLAKGKGLGAPLEVSTDIALDAKVIARSKGHGNRMPSRVGYDECLHVRRHIRTRIRVSNTRPCCIPTFWGKALCTYWDISLMCDPCDCSEHHWGGRNLSSQAQHYGSATTLHWKRRRKVPTRFERLWTLSACTF